MSFLFWKLYKNHRMADSAKKERRRLGQSVNYQTQRKKVDYIHRKISRQREDYLHQISKHEVENQDVIAADDLKVWNLIKNRHLAQAIVDADWRKFLIMLQHKGNLYGKTVVLVPPQYMQRMWICHERKRTPDIT